MVNPIKIFFLASLAVLVVIGSFIFYLFVGKSNVSGNIIWGVDFSQSQAEYLGLNWKELYLAIINDLKVRNIKLHTNWSWVEGEKRDFYFNDIDWQIKQAEQKNVKIIYVLGMKTGRWPECHVPNWAKNASKEQQQAEVLSYITQVVTRYKNSKAIAYWQVENEPLFKFGECPDWYYDGGNFLQTEVRLVKALDPSRKIIISDSGEQSNWAEAAKIADIVGVTMYRNAWAHITDSFGFRMYSFLNPTVYTRKAEIIKKNFDKKVICIELQAEPWTKGELLKAPLQEQEQSMNLKMFKENIQFAKMTGFDTFYFWGVEWWYWMKEKQNRPEIWNEAKNFFSQK